MEFSYYQSKPHHSRRADRLLYIPSAGRTDAVHVWTAATSCRVCLPIQRRFLLHAVCVEPRPSAASVCCSAPAPAGEIDRQLVRGACSYRSISPAAPALSSKPTAAVVDRRDRRTDGRTDRQTDGRTLDRFVSLTAYYADRACNSSASTPAVTLCKLFASYLTVT